jgi:DNA polymerase-4
MEQVLKRLGLTTIGDLANFPRDLLIERLGKPGGVLHDRAQGIDLNPIFPKRKKVKTISRETTFNLDEASRLKLRATIRSQSEKISRDLSNNQQGGRTITIKIRSAPFETSLRSTTSNEQFANSDQIFDRATKLFENLWSECGYKPLRLIGIGITNLSPVAQQLQFGGQLSILESNVSKLRQRYGERIIVRASELGNSHKK